MYRLIDHKQQILRPKGDQSFHTVCAMSRHWKRRNKRIKIVGYNEDFKRILTNYFICV